MYDIFHVKPRSEMPLSRFFKQNMYRIVIIIYNEIFIEYFFTFFF